MEEHIDQAISRTRGELSPLEPRRMELLSANRRDRLVAAVAGAVGLLLVFLQIGSGAQHPLPGFIAAGIGIVIAGVFLVRAQNRSANFRQQLKLALIPRLLDAIRPGLRYDPSSGIPEGMFAGARLFSHNADRYKVEDLIHGRVGDTDIMMSEVHAEYRSTTTDSKGRTRTTYHTFFRGIFMCADFHKHFHSTLRIMPNSTSFLGGLGRALSAFRPFSSEQLVRLEDPEFEQSFNVYGSDDVEARYILSPSMMRRILDLRRRWNAEIRFSFLESNVCIAIQHGHNFFEPRIDRPVDNQQQLQQIAGEIRVCLDLVDDLNLNTRIWSKE